jgi:hypothetical protein
LRTNLADTECEDQSTPAGEHTSQDAFSTYLPQNHMGEAYKVSSELGKESVGVLVEVEVL